MARRADQLREIGLEGFALIDKYYGPSPRRSINGSDQGVFPARQERWVVQVPNGEMEVPFLNSKDAASQLGGIMIMNYPKGKPQNRRGNRPIIKH